jgi:hypothetical protein
MKHPPICISFEVYILVILQTVIVWVVMLYSLEKGYHCFREICWLHLQGQT